MQHRPIAQDLSCRHVKEVPARVVSLITRGWCLTANCTRVTCLQLIISSLSRQFILERGTTTMETVRIKRVLLAVSQGWNRHRVHEASF